LLGDAYGKVDGRYTIIYTGAGLAMQPKESTWDIIGIEAWVSKKANGEDYRRLLEKYGSAACGDEFDIDINCKVNTIDFWLR
jgi:succinyl-CoA synthetase beta subunit